MKNFLVVFKFELSNYFKNKAFRISTIVLSLLIIIGLSVPSIMSAIGKPIFGDDEGNGKADLESKVKYGVIINNDVIDENDLQIQLPNAILVYPSNEDELKDMIKSDEVKVGFVIDSQTKYKYLVENTSMTSSHRYLLEDAMLNIYRAEALTEQGIDSEQVSSIYNIPIEHDMDVLGKDSMKNFFYTYILIFGLYFITLFYGQLTATSVSSEKSNRSMEILVTSTSTESLMFGKVIAGALAGVFQFGTMILVAFITYKLNISAWNNNLDYIFNIPGKVLATFAIFGILGYLFFLFVFGVIGALVSRTEDVGSVSTPVMLIFMVAFFISVFGLSHPDMLLLKVASYIPFTSFMAMFVRVSMGNVSVIQVFISLSLLAATTVATGIVGAKIYRLGTLMYGDPVKISKAIKLLRNK